MSTCFHTVEVSDPTFETGGLRQVTAKSRAIGGRVDMTLHLPSAVQGLRHVPIVILLHGIYGSHWGWALSGGAHRTNEQLSGAGEIVPMILAMPSDGLWGDGTGYVRHTRGDYESWIVEEVPALVREVVPETDAGSPLFLAGLSMGGFGALRLGARHPDRFRAMSGLSSATHLDQLKDAVEEDLSLAGIAPGDWSLFEALRTSVGVPPFRFDCGTEDFLLEANRRLHNELDQAGIVHTYREYPGGHTWEYWRAHLAETLRFFSGVLGES